ncbi:hypothetical protein BG07_5809 (plasmid) [Bacillus pseudomycoides]|nr:hypothetical protein BG07_5809 [Bacillus pseudomycoides]EEM02579.1 hypothetical protein bmyco0002_50330 [Bacillus pseudomycoides]EEM08030.1 hypothetical protein bmyco0003_52660 [Bacillus pseudomycoides]EEM14007.1 hypothetical protein bpmyx0001_51250 [Bacillus pseudomycoides DSM 12442]
MIGYVNFICIRYIVLLSFGQVETSIQEKQARFTFNILNLNKGA